MFVSRWLKALKHYRLRVERDRLESELNTIGLSHPHWDDKIKRLNEIDEELRDTKQGEP